MAASAQVAFKRDQVERAIARTCYAFESNGAPTPRLRADIRRLLEVDRDIGTAQGPDPDVSYAFYSDAPPGKGAEIAWGAYDAFALMIGVRLLRSEFPQRAAVEFLRMARRPLKREFKRILSTPPEVRRPDLATRGNRLTSDLMSGVLVRDPEQMVFLVLEAAEIRPAIAIDDGAEQRLLNLRRSSKELLGSMTEFSHRGAVATVLELVNSAYQLVAWLNHFPAPRRGRP